MTGTSRVNREIYARFCRRLVVKFLRPTWRFLLNIFVCLCLGEQHCSKAKPNGRPRTVFGYGTAERLGNLWNWVSWLGTLR